MKIKVKDQYEFLSRMFFLAYEGSKVFGMGVLQARSGMNEKQVFSNIVTSGDYQGRVNSEDSLCADYVFGRMMKLTIKLRGSNVFEILNSKERPQSDYQSWCNTYPTYQDLVDATAKSLGVQVEKV